MVMANAGQMASQSLHAIHRSSPEGYLRRACSPRKRGEMGPFSKGYMIVYLRPCQPSYTVAVDVLGLHLRGPEKLLQTDVHPPHHLHEQKIPPRLIHRRLALIPCWPMTNPEAMWKDTPGARCDWSSELLI